MFSCIPENAINLIFLNTHQMQAQLHKLLSLLKNPNMELEKKKKNPKDTNHHIQHISQPATWHAKVTNHHQLYASTKPSSHQLMYAMHPWF